MIRLPLYEVHVWHIEINNENYQNSQNLIHILSKEEQKRLREFKFDKDKKSYLTSHVILKLLVAHYVHIKLEDVAFYYNTYGKPYIYGSDIYFNMSHTLERTVIVFDTREIGIDIEYINRILEIEEISKIAFSEREKLILKKENNSKKYKKFFDIWTRKEALLKARGTGICDELKDIDLGELTEYKTHNYSFKIHSFQPSNNNYIGHIAYQQSKEIQHYDWNYSQHSKT